jgi:Na+/H+ antiporter NhaB
MYYFVTKGVGLHFGRFFLKTHPVTIPRVLVEQVYLYSELLAELESSRSPKLQLPFVN